MKSFMINFASSRHHFISGVVFFKPSSRGVTEGGRTVGGFPCSESWRNSSRVFSASWDAGRSAKQGCQWCVEKEPVMMVYLLGDVAFGMIGIIVGSS